MTNVKEEILTVLSSVSHIDTARLSLNSDTNLFKAGYFDSLTVVQFIVAIEKKFKIKISKNEIKYTSFETLAGIEDLIKEKIK